MIIAISGLTIEQGWRGWLRRRHGNAGAGKDEAAKQLILSHNYTPLAFADPLKRILKDVFDWSDDQLWGPSENRNKEDPRYPRTVFEGNPLVHSEKDPAPVGLTIRHALQTLGDGWGRNECYLNVWVDYAMRVAKKLGTGEYGYDRITGLYKYGSESGKLLVGEPRTNVVITDLRYKNEAEAVRAAGGLLVRCKRWVPKIKVTPTHASENDLLDVHDADFDWILLNKGTVQELWNQVDSMVGNL